MPEINNLGREGGGHKRWLLSILGRGLREPLSESGLHENSAIITSCRLKYIFEEQVVILPLYIPSCMCYKTGRESEILGRGGVGRGG